MLNVNVVRRQYSRRARIYDWTIHLWKLWGLSDAWRQKAVRALNLQLGSTVLELGCGTGLNFPFLQEVIGQTGKIIGVDLAPAMLAEAQEKIERYGWNNVELIEADVSQFGPPKGVDGILSTYAMSVIPDHDTVIKRCARAAQRRPSCDPGCEGDGQRPDLPDSALDAYHKAICGQL